MSCLNASTTSEKADKSLPIQRNWVSAKNLTTNGDDAGTDDFVVVSYNILADCHVTDETYPYLPKGYRTIYERHPQLLMELRHHGNADVICLQEVNGKYFKETLEPALLELGYEGIHGNKALGVDEGVATFYRPSRFELESHRVVHCKDQVKEEISKRPLLSDLAEAILERTLKETVMMFLLLRCKKTRRVVTLANVHLFWMNHIAMDVVTLQIALALKALVELADGGNSALLMCGDFNTEPHMPAYQLLRDGHFSDQSVEMLRKFDIVPKENPNKCFHLVDVMSASFQHQICHFKSAYKAVMGAEVPFSQFHDTVGTEWKERQQKTEALKEVDRRVGPDSNRPRGRRIKALDYLWFSSESLSCVGALGMVAREVLDSLYACPNTVFPSDHLLMKAEFHLKDITLD